MTEELMAEEIVRRDDPSLTEIELTTIPTKEGVLQVRHTQYQGTITERLPKILTKFNVHRLNNACFLTYHLLKLVTVMRYSV